MITSFIIRYPARIPTRTTRRCLSADFRTCAFGATNVLFSEPRWHPSPKFWQAWDVRAGTDADRPRTSGPRKDGHCSTRLSRPACLNLAVPTPPGARGFRPLPLRRSSERCRRRTPGYPASLRWERSRRPSVPRQVVCGIRQSGIHRNGLLIFGDGMRNVALPRI